MSLTLSTLHGKNKRQAKKRRGRGNAAGQGTYSGRGLKGQRSRSGGKHAGGHAGKKVPTFILQLKKRRGFQSETAKVVAVNLRDLERFDEGSTVTPKVLRERHLVADRSSKVKILGSGTLSKKLQVEAHAFSETAKRAITTVGGTAVVIKLPEKTVLSKDKKTKRKA